MPWYSPNQEGNFFQVSNLFRPWQYLFSHCTKVVGHRAVFTRLNVMEYTVYKIISVCGSNVCIIVVTSWLVIRPATTYHTAV